MLTNHFIKVFCIIKFQLNLFIFLLFSFVSEIVTENDSLAGHYLNCLLLQNGKIFIANYNGMLIYDKNLKTEYYSHPFSGVEINKQNLPKTLIAQFPTENGMIICLVKNTIFFLEGEGEYLYSDTLPNYDYTYAHTNLLTYKKDGDYFYYIITFIKDNSLYILYYKANNLNNELLHEEIFKPFYFDFPKISIKETSLGCQIMNSSNKGKVLTCCFQTTNGPFIIIQSFIIENYFKAIEEDICVKVESPDAKIIRSSISEEGKNMVSFYRDNNGAGYYFIYNIDNNTIIKNEPLIKACVDNYNKFKLFYFKDSGEFVFTCTNNDKGFTIMRMDSNFNIINSDKFSDINYISESTFNSFSIVYDINENKYAFIMDQYSDVGNYQYAYKIGKYNITIDFNSDHSGGTPPDPYPETLPSTTVYNLPNDNKFYLNAKEFYRPVTINEQNGIIINFLSQKNPMILDKNNEPIRKEIYAMNIESLPSSGQLKYIINGELKDVELNKRIFGEFKFFYIPEKFGIRTNILYRVYLKNYSIASSLTYYWLVICKINCTCTTDTGTCPSCADGYGFYRTSGNPSCVKGSEFCSNRYYTDKASYYLKCINETECPDDYPFYNEYNRECRHNITNDNDEEDEIPTFPESTTQEPKSDNTEESSKEGDESESESSNESSYNNPEDSEIENTNESSSDNQEESEAESYSESSPDNPEESETSESSSNNPEESEADSESSEDNLEESPSSNSGQAETENSSESSPDNPEESETSESSSNNPEESESESTSESQPDNPEESKVYDSSESSPDNPEESETGRTSDSSPDNTEESESNEESSSKNEESESNNPNEYSEENSDSSKSEEIKGPSTDNSLLSEKESETSEKNNLIDLSSIKGLIDDIKEDALKEIIEYILGNKNIIDLANSELIKETNKTHQILSNLIKFGNISMSSGSEDIILKTEKIIYQITNTENQKSADEKADISIIDLGECEKIIKKNISYEDDSTPLIILKIETKKEGLKSPSIQYEVYNPYTKEKIDLKICSNIIIKISAPVNLTDEEVELYDDLKNQGYDLYDAKGSFYQEICTQFTSKNGTDVILSDRRNYYYDQNATFCEESCTYQGINTETQKVMCYCVSQNEMNHEESYFNKKKFFENFYKIKDYTNYQVLYCYKLVFSSKGLIKNIIFYIFIVLVLLFLITMIINLLKALKKIDEIIFKIFQDRFMFEIMKNIIESKRNEKNENNNIEGIPNSSIEPSKKLNIFQKLRNKYKKSSAPPIVPININNNISNNMEDKSVNINNIKKRKKRKKHYNKSNNNIINNNANNKHKKKLHKIKNLKMNNVNNNKNVHFRMDCKEDYSKSIIDRNNNFSNIYDEIMNNKGDFGNAFDGAISTQNIINLNIVNNINNSTKNFGKYTKKETVKSSYSNNNSNKNLKNSGNLVKSNEIEPKDNNNSNPPLKKKKKLSNNRITKRCNAIQNQNMNQESSSSDKKTFFKKSLKRMKRKSKTKIFRQSLDILGLKSKKILGNSGIQSVNFKNDDTASKNQLHSKNLPLVNEKIQEKQNNINQNKVLENPKEEQTKKNNSKFIDEELNKMDYENALIYDQREYCQYYLSLLKKKHLIILVFISNDDYNVFLLKFSLFILSLALFFALNTLFFRDSTMRHIFTDEGRYNFFYQIPKVLYSTLISSIMTYILKLLSLSQNDLIEIKKESDRNKARKMADNSKKCLSIKLYIFFLIGICLMLFFWYYTTSFAAVYQNTQLHLIKDTLTSFGISMIYPFVINIIPGLFRIPSLKAKNKDRKCLYRTSKILAFL